MACNFFQKVAGVSLLTLLLMLQADAIAQQQTASRQGIAARSSATSDGFVLLANQNVLRGNAVQSGAQVVVSRADGSQIHLSKSNVQCWGTTMRDLYEFRVSQRQRNDLSGYVADIQWCINHHSRDPQLLQFAKIDLKHALQFAPSDPSLIRLASQLQRQLVANESTKHAVPVISDAQRDANAEHIRQVDFQAKQLAASKEIDGQTLLGFARDVQPLLINRCGACHGQLSDQKWQMLVPAIGSRGSARMTRENYLALAEYLNFNSGLESELRLRAMDGHAGKQHTFGLRETTATKAFDRWLQYAKPAGAALEIAKRNFSASPNGKNNVSQPKSDAQDDSSQPRQIKRLPPVGNPFDPAIFNRRQQLR